MSSVFKNLFTPIELGPIKLRNRIYVTPHTTGFASDGDYLPGETLAYYCAERAKGGVGLIEVSMGIVRNETTSIMASDFQSQFSPINGGFADVLSGRWPLRGYDPEVVKGYSRLAKLVHQHGGKCVIELGACGTNLGNESGVSPYPRPSLLPFTTREITEEEVDEMAEGYGKAAKYVQESGLDGVDIHATHGTLLSEFLSLVMNRRKDKFGGSMENRMRPLMQVIDRVRESVGNEIAVGMRLLGDERFKGGYGPEMAAEMAARLDGKVDWITADSGYSMQQEEWQTVPMYIDSGYNLRITDPIKRVVKQTKIGAVGRYIDPYFAERLIAENSADMVAMTRALIADPELPNKAREGRIDDIRPCIGGVQDCWGRMARGLPMTCTVNPVVSREKSWGIGSLAKASTSKKILVIGGGPAGLEVARVSAERGHSVVIYEKGRNLGGQAYLASKLPGRADIRAVVNWEEQQLKKLNVVIKYGMDVTSDPEIVDFILEEEKPDSVIIATGSHSIKTGFQPYTFCEIEGHSEPIVMTDEEVLLRDNIPGSKIIIADSIGFIEAPGIAELLAKQGKDVEIVTNLINIALELKFMNHWEHLFRRISAANVKVSPLTWIRKINGHDVTLYNVYYEKQERLVEDVDGVVLITGKVQNDSLYNAFRGKVKGVELIGDAKFGGARIGYAMYEGQRVGRIL